jgi:hypothetical protein
VAIAAKGVPEARFTVEAHEQAKRTNPAIAVPQGHAFA